MKILVIEDDPEVSGGLGRRLQHAGFEVALAATGQDGLAMVQAGQPDLIVLDLGLPDMRGDQVLRQIRASGNAVPAVVLTGYESAAWKCSAFGAGADDCMTKPFDPRELIARVHAVLHRSHQSGR